MEYKQIFVSIAVAFVIGLAAFNLLTYYNDTYEPIGGAHLDTSFFGTGFSEINDSLTSTSIKMYDSLNNTGVGITPATQAAAQSLSTFTILKEFVGFVPNLMSYGASILHIPDAYVKIATAVFVFAFVLTLAYLLILGVRRFIG